MRRLAVHRRGPTAGLATTAFLLAGLFVAAGLTRARVTQPERPTVKTENCTTECHARIATLPVQHGPVAQDVCLVCHSYQNPAEHTFELTADDNDLCAQCHVLDNRRVTHAPVAEGSCTECHDPHGSEHPMMLVADVQRDLCMQCHVDFTAGAAYVHGPVAEGACILCHEVHSSNQDMLLTNDPARLCQSCHDEVKTEPEVGLHVHSAIQDGCTKCHDPHASDHKFQLTQQMPGLCLTCHDNLQDQIFGDQTGIVHGPLRDDGGCSQCHNPHSSRLPNLQNAEQPQLCLECHDREIDIGEDRPLTNMAALLEANPNHHGPIREGMCTACHQPHASEHYRLLLEEYPAQFYAKFEMQTFALCFSCHIPDLVLTERGGGLTEFRDGQDNLHWLHVNREKGRTCRACHEVHASTQQSHIRKAVPFGPSGWMLELNFKPSESGGSCAPACHKTRTYDRNATPVTTETDG